MDRTIGILPLGRPTFDVPFAQAMLDAMVQALRDGGHRLAGEPALLMDGDAAVSAIEQFEKQPPDVLLVLQVTFTDASVVVQAAERLRLPMALWAIPEPRLGGRLRLNSFCGLNLASHALGLQGKAFSWLYRHPTEDGTDDALRKLLAEAEAPDQITLPMEAAGPATTRFKAEVAGSRICRIGAHPEGFDTCRYDPDTMLDLSGVSVDALEIDALFDLARNSDSDQKKALRATISGQINNLSSLDPEQMDRSIGLKVALDSLRSNGAYDAFALRCWPETFTEYGGAVCGPVSLLGEAKVPCACEADVYGALTQLYLQAISGDAVFLADIVDMDCDDDTGVVWHCGQAPLSMADPDFDVEGTIHTNRKMPLLYQFPLKPGPVTFLRISQAQGETKLLFAFGEMLKRPMAFTGTSGVVRFSSGTKKALQNMMASGMEHHMALAYGDFRQEVRGLAAELGIPALNIG